MRILLLADINSEHTQKWATGLAGSGYSIGIFSFSKPLTNWYAEFGIEYLDHLSSVKNSVTLLSKLSYVAHLPELKKSIRRFKPDVLHAHYASSYGLLGALSGFHPFIISVWGTDVMKFPHKNWVTKQIIKYNLRSADAVCATSHTLEKHIHRLIHKKVEVIPFGVDLNEFANQKPATKDASVFTIGCVKSLEKIYNTRSLILAFAELKQKHPQQKMRLMLVGDGSERKTLEALVHVLKIEEHVIFEGKLPHEEVAFKINQMDVLVNVSEYESFGVSVIEAMACEVPVIVSEAEGLREVVDSPRNGCIVAYDNIEQIVTAMEKLMLNEPLRNAVGLNAAARVRLNYNWLNNIGQMMAVYNSVL